MLAQRRLASPTDLRPHTPPPSMTHEPGVPPHCHHQDLEQDDEDANSRPELECSDLRVRRSTKGPRGVVKCGSRYLASVYAKWLEIRAPLRRSLTEALLDHIMLGDIKHHILRSSGEALLTDLGWGSLVQTASEHQRDASALRARVMLPAEFWIGTRLATPHQNLRAALRTWHRLRSHPSWTWSSALQGGGAVSHSAGLARATLPELWAGLRAEIITVSVQAGVDRSSLEARLRRLEEQHSRTHGSFERRLLQRVARLLRREQRENQTAKIRERKALRTLKRVAQLPGQHRSAALRRRLHEEKDMAMGEILARRVR